MWHRDDSFDSCPQQELTFFLLFVAEASLACPCGAVLVAVPRKGLSFIWLLK